MIIHIPEREGAERLDELQRKRCFKGDTMMSWSNIRVRVLMHSVVATDPFETDAARPRCHLPRHLEWFKLVDYSAIICSTRSRHRGDRGNSPAILTETFRSVKQRSLLLCVATLGSYCSAQLMFHLGIHGSGLRVVSTQHAPALRCTNLRWAPNQR